MARKKGLVWKHFTELKSGKYKQGQCRYCGIKYISNVDHMQKHVKVLQILSFGSQRDDGNEERKKTTATNNT